MTEYRGFRDAIHVPFLVCECVTPLQPGQKCTLRGSGEDITCVPWNDGDEIMWHGVADPFRESSINGGEFFRLYIRKECFSKMTHVFTIEVHDRGGTDTCHSVCDIF